MGFVSHLTVYFTSPWRCDLEVFSKLNKHLVSNSFSLPSSAGRHKWPLTVLLGCVCTASALHPTKLLTALTRSEDLTTFRSGTAEWWNRECWWSEYAWWFGTQLHTEPLSTCSARLCGPSGRSNKASFVILFPYLEYIQKIRSGFLCTKKHVFPISRQQTPL